MMAWQQDLWIINVRKPSSHVSIEDYGPLIGQKLKNVLRSKPSSGPDCDWLT